MTLPSDRQAGTRPALREDASPSPDVVAMVEFCLNHYGDDLNLSQSELIKWQVVRGQVSPIPPPTAAQLGSAVRSVLDELIEGLRLASGSQDSAAYRRYVIADKLYRKGERPVEVYHSLLAISKSQFYRERADTFEALAGRLVQAEARAIERQRADSIKKLAMLPPATTSRLFGVDFLIRKVLDAVLAPHPPGLILLDGLGGLGKTAIVRHVVERAWITGGFGGLAWISAQRRTWNWSRLQTSDDPPLTLDRLYDLLLRQLNQSLLTFDRLFGILAEDVPAEEATFEHVLDVLSREMPNADPPPESLRAKFISLLELLWAAPTLIVLDGLEAVEDMPAVLESMWEIVSRSQAKVIITSRRRLHEYQNAYALHMNELDSANAVLLAKHYGGERGVGSLSKASADELNRIVEASGANPLAMRLLVDQLSALPLSQVYHDFCHTGTLSAALYDFVYEPAWRSLPEPSQAVLAALANIHSDFITWDKLRARTSMTPEALNHALKELASSCLVHVTENLAPNYWISTLTRRFVLSKLGAL